MKKKLPSSDDFFKSLEISEEESINSGEELEILEQIKNKSQELFDVIENNLEEEKEEISLHQQTLIDLKIPYCKLCKLQFTVDLYGKPQCGKNLIECPVIKK